MGAPRFGPAPYVNPDGFERRLRTRSLQQADLDGPPSKLAQTAEFPPPGPSCSGRTKTTAVDSEDEQAFDVDDFRAWWQRGLSQRGTENPSRDRILIGTACALVGVAIVGSVFALKAGAPGALDGPPNVPSANHTAGAQHHGGETAGDPADLSTMPPTGLSGTTPVAPKVAAPIASRQPAQTSDTKPARVVSVRRDGTLIAQQLPSAAEFERSPAFARRPQTARQVCARKKERRNCHCGSFGRSANETSWKSDDQSHGRHD